MRHICGVIEDDNAAVADHGTDLDEGLVIERRVELLGRDVGTQRPAYLHSLDGSAAGRTATPVFDQLAQRNAEGLLDQSAALDVAGELECERAFRAIDARTTAYRPRRRD